MEGEIIRVTIETLRDWAQQYEGFFKALYMACEPDEKVIEIHSIYNKYAFALVKCILSGEPVPDILVDFSCSPSLEAERDLRNMNFG